MRQFIEKHWKKAIYLAFFVLIVLAIWFYYTLYILLTPFRH